MVIRSLRTLSLQGEVVGGTGHDDPVTRSEYEMTTSVGHRVTLDDVARAAGVSRATAARALGGYGASSPAARERVNAAAARLGYTPDAAARALVSGVGFQLVVAVVGTTPSALADPYVARVVASAAAVCAQHGIGVSLQWLPRHDPAQLVRFADDRGVRGVLVVNTTEQVLQVVPTALAGRIASIGVGSPTVPSFDVDNAKATTVLVHRLYASGRRRIALVSGSSWLPGAGRSAHAYREAMLAAGLPVRVVPGDFRAASGQAATASTLRRWPDTDAVLATSDAMALGAINALRRHGREVPDDVAVAGFDDIPFAALANPTLTTASHPVDTIATAAATAVLDGRGVPPVTSYASQLILRESA
jgi:DNA-binding LacI/PurR family transcriptional regulator